MNRNSLLQVGVVVALSLGGLGTVAQAGTWVAASQAAAGSGLDLQDYQFAVAGETCSTAGEQRYSDNLSVLICNGSTWMSNDTNRSCIFEYGHVVAGTLDISTSPWTFKHANGSHAAFISSQPSKHHQVGNSATQIFLYNNLYWKTLSHVRNFNGFEVYNFGGTHSNHETYCKNGHAWVQKLTAPVPPIQLTTHHCDDYVKSASLSNNNSILGVNAVCREPDGCNWCN
jgi:hypothetical protein